MLERVKLTTKDIYEKEFKTSVRGYKQEEVDQYLDLIIKDYETFIQMVEQLQQENSRLRKQVEQSHNAPKQQPVASASTNLDILQRIANLEKHVFGNKLSE